MSKPASPDRSKTNSNIGSLKLGSKTPESKSPRSSKFSISKPNSSKPSEEDLADKPIDLRIYGEGDEDITPTFIYGGPFIRAPQITSFLDMKTPMNLKLQGTFKASYAHRSLRECMPVIITKMIDKVSKDAGSGKDATSTEDSKSTVQQLSKLKSHFMTNKPFEKFVEKSHEAQRWNEWIDGVGEPRYFFADWMFTESYIYRKVREFASFRDHPQNYDVFESEKKDIFDKNVEAICMLGNGAVNMLEGGGKEKKKNDFITLLKICLWSQKYCRCLTEGNFSRLPKDPPPPPIPEKPTKGKKGKDKGKSKTDLKSKSKVELTGPPPPPVEKPMDPFQFVIDYKDKLIVDDSGKVFDQLMTKSDNMRKAINNKTAFKEKCSCHRLAKVYGVMKCPSEEIDPDEKPTEPAADEIKIPCPTKITVPPCVQFDIVCENAGFELVADLCLATFLVSHKIVDRVRFHVKQYPWYVTQATEADVNNVMKFSKEANYSKSYAAQPGPDGNPVGEGKTVNATGIKQMAEKWSKYFDDGVFVVHSDPYWTYPHPYSEMKKLDYWMYRKLQTAVCILFKGDLNYRKLIGDRNVNPYATFDSCLQGFNPAPIIANRVIKCDIIAGMPKGKYEVFNRQDAKWMENAEYGTIQFTPKAEALKPSDRPCPDYRDQCKSKVCPPRPEFQKPGVAL